MNGAAYIVAELSRQERYEAKRKKWVEIREVNGVTTEFLMVECCECGQPYPRQRVIRFSDDELFKWQDTIVKQNVARRRISSIPGFALPVLIGFGLVVGLVVGSVYAGSAAILIALVCYLCWFSTLSSQTEKDIEAFRERRNQILSVYGNLLEEDVGIKGQYWKKYVILPAKEEG